MTSRVTACWLLVLCAVPAGYAEKTPTGVQAGPPGSKITPAYLVAHGFKYNASAEWYEAKHVRLADVARDLGLPLSALEHVVNQAHTDNRYVKLPGGIYIEVRSEVLDKNPKNAKYGVIAVGSLDDPSALCTAIVDYERPPKKVFRKTESSPHLHIISVATSKQGGNPLRITFQLSADGKTPLGVSQTHFGFAIAPKGKLTRHGIGHVVSFQQGTPDRIIVSPGRPATLTLIAEGEWLPPLGAGPVGVSKDLPPGEYTVCIRIVQLKDEGPGFDYNWIGTEYSDEYKVTVK
jgi:hypothetical protein